jgi:hypothetical protein
MLAPVLFLKAELTAVIKNCSKKIHCGLHGFIPGTIAGKPVF